MINSICEWISHAFWLLSVLFYNLPEEAWIPNKVEALQMWAILSGIMTVGYYFFRFSIWSVRHLCNFRNHANRMDDSPLDAGIIEPDKYPNLQSSCEFVANHIIASFKEGMTITEDAKELRHRSLGMALLYHWRHARKYHGDKCLTLNMQQANLLRTNPEMFFIQCNAITSYWNILEAQNGIFTV